jgi:DNA-directed RNA polymerase subunit E"
MVTKACTKCKRIVEGKKCPVCNDSKLSNRWYGLLVILDKDSEIAKEMDIEPGRYALKVK